MFAFGLLSNSGYQTSGMGNCPASCLAAGGPSRGVFSHAHKSLKMKSCWRSRAARLDSDQPKLDFICRYFKISMAISAVQIWVLTALALVPRNDFTFAVCFKALKNSCRVRDWRGICVERDPFPAPPHRTSSEGFPPRAPPGNFVERVMWRLG